MKELTNDAHRLGHGSPPSGIVAKAHARAKMTLTVAGGNLSSAARPLYGKAR